MVLIHRLTFSILVQFCGCKFTGIRLGDFPPPDFSKTIQLSIRGYEAFAEVNHNFGVIPFHVRVYALSKDGDNANYLFEGVGSCQNDGQGSGGFGGVLFAYNKHTVRLWAPTKMGRVIFVGEGWGGNTNSQSSTHAYVTVEAWKHGPSPSFEKILQIHSKRTHKIDLKHPLRQVPELISVQVVSTNKKEGDYLYNAIGSSQTSSMSRSFGGVVFAYNDQKVVLWTPNKSKTGCINIGKRWGNGRHAARFIQNCTLHIRLWVNSFPPPVFQTNWITYYANQHKLSYVEVRHDLKLLPLYVKVQYRNGNKTDSLIFEGFGSAQTTPISTYRYGGILYAYNKENVRLWLPTSSKPAQAFIVFVGDGWGKKNDSISSASADIRIQIYADKCFKDSDVVDGQGYCRDASDITLTQTTGAWGKCSNPCGDGKKYRNVTDCTGRSLQTILNCTFQEGLCGFKSEGFPWTITTGIPGEKLSQNMQIPSQGPSYGMHFIFSNTSKAKPGDMGSLMSKDIVNGEKCILSFKYISESYFGIIRVDVVRSDGKTQEDVWHMLDAEVMKGTWRTGYINFDYILKDTPIKRFSFVQQVRSASGVCPGECHPISLTNIVLQCVEDDSYVISNEQCDKKEDILPSCLLDIFKPFRRGPAWSVNHTFIQEDDKEKEIGLFVTAVGEIGELIATYKFHVMKSGSYNLWLDSFATNKENNGVTVQMQDGEKISRDLIYTAKHALWFPYSVIFELQAGTYFVHMYVLEKNFRYKNLMIAPRHITVWTNLGMQSRFIPDSSFRTLNGKSSEYYVYPRLNGARAWMSQDQNEGLMYLQITLPELALINKIATQGGSYHDTRLSHCQTANYKIKFSLDGTNFVFYRIDALKEVYLFTGNTDSPEDVKENILAYAVVARSIRFYPVKYDLYNCLRIELYGYYMVPSMCPGLRSKVREKACAGDGNCGYKNAECAINEALNRRECTCSKSYHGEKCELAGCYPNPCKNNATCFGDQMNFTCMCKPGFKGRYCEVPCPIGSYGIGCYNQCKCKDMEFCHPVTGNCSCLPGYRGLHCKTPCANKTYGQDCKQMCSCKKFMECDHVTGICQCKAGFYGDNCEEKCPLGRFGKDCDQICSCVYGTCDSTNGFCDCGGGWMGPSCDIKCEQGRFGKNCKDYCHNPKNSVCDTVTGHYTCDAGFMGTHCQHRCIDGTYGKNCQSICTCTSNNTERCDIQTGECICSPGYQGQRCEERCENSWGPKCIYQCQCQHDAMCDGFTGNCTCLNGYVGMHCEKQCGLFRYGEGCAKNCSCIKKHTEHCSPQDGICNCKPGYRGDRCQLKCDQNHWGKNCVESCKCLNDGLCDHRSGFCYCTDGFQGQFCGQECDEDRYGKHCESICQCQHDGYCYNVNGKCECTAGYTGDFCEKTCPDSYYGLNCLKLCSCVKNQTLMCDPINGSCSCLSGYQGNYCENECVDGYHGLHCTSLCSCHHSKLPCNKRTGDCICTPGFIGRHCVNDCDWTKYGSNCGQRCTCGHEELCNNVDGECFNATTYTFKIHLLVNVDIFTVEEARGYLKRNLAYLMLNCFHQYQTLAEKHPVQNITPFGTCALSKDASSINRRSGDNVDQYVVRIVDITRMYSKNDDDVSSVRFVLSNNSVPVNGALVEQALEFIGAKNLTKVLKHTYFIGEVFTSKQNVAWHEGKMKYIVISVAVFGGLLVIFMIGLIIRCTKRVQYPSLFTKIKQDPKEIEMPMLLNKNTHILAFENPYYDVIAAMGLDDDIEEDYFNPLYDNMLELQTDSETEPEDMYYGYRNNRYRGSHYPYDKDSGFSSGILM